MIDVDVQMHRISDCIVCGGDEFDTVYHRDGYVSSSPTHRLTMDIQYDLCNRCGLVFMNPQLDQVCWNEYLQHVSFTALSEPTVEACKRRFQPHELAYLDRHISSPARALEIGCGDGHLLFYLKQQYGHTVSGIDLSRTYVDYAVTELGLDVRQCQFEKLDAEDGSYDLVVSKHAFEHMSDPFQSLLKVGRVLSDEGVFMLEVPSIHYPSFSIRDMFSAHNYMFSPETIRMLIARAGFEIIDSVEGGGLTYLLKKGEPEQISYDSSVALARSSLEKSLERYNRTFSVASERINQFVERCREKGYQAAVFGSGEHTLGLFELFDFDGCDIRFILDSNRQLSGTERYGYRVIHPDQLEHHPVDAILISSDAYQTEMVEQLAAIGYRGQVETIYLDGS